MQSIADGVSNLIVSVLILLIGPTVVMLLIRRFVPYLGDRLWRLYCDALIWLLRAPFLVVRLLVREITANRRRP